MLPYLSNLPSTFPLDEELEQLKRLEQSGFVLAPSLIIPASIEENFYRLNNLPEQLALIFKDVNKENPDEDDIEELEPQALALFKRHFLLDEFIDLFYTALEPLDSKLIIRRSGSDQATVANKGRPSLIALKNLWASSWTFDAILERLEKTQTIAVEASHILIQAKNDGPPLHHEAASEIFKQKVSVKMDSLDRITQIVKAS